jgi:iron(III) transport system ATP-binding protein
VAGRAEIETHDLTKVFGQGQAAFRALDAVTLTIDKGEFFTLLGPSGCGKTTLLRLIAGFEQPTAGELLIDGKAVAGQGPNQRPVNTVFQNYALFPHMTVQENIGFGLKMLGQPKSEIDATTDAMLRLVKMTAMADRKPASISGGQQQRVALARALAPSPRIILLDEPFSSLDARLRVQIRDQTLHVLKSSGVATVMVTHDPEEAMFMGDRIVLMHQGRIVQTGTPVELYSKPVNAFVTTFFSDVNVIRGMVQGGQVATPLGRVASAGFQDGAEVEIMFRPETVQVFKADAGSPLSGVPGEVLATRLLPGATLVHLRIAPRAPRNFVATDAPDIARDNLPANAPESIHLHARVPCLFPMPEGAHVHVHVSMDQVYVFPAESS